MIELQQTIEVSLTPAKLHGIMVSIDGDKLLEETVQSMNSNIRNLCNSAHEYYAAICLREISQINLTSLLDELFTLENPNLDGNESGNDIWQRRREISEYHHQLNNTIGLFRSHFSFGYKIGAMVLFDYAKAFEFLRADLNKIRPSIPDFYDHKVIREALKQFNAEFPDAKEVRDSAAHPSEKFNDPREIGKHTVSGDHEIGPIRGRGVFGISGATRGSEYFATLNGRAVSYELSHKKYAELISITKLIFLAFNSSYTRDIDALLSDAQSNRRG